jgi:uncharacterized membrane protein (UPF0127 family)
VTYSSPLAWPKTKHATFDHMTSAGARGALGPLRVEVCRTFMSRLRGLLGRSSLSASDALLILPCKSVHTVGMKFAIDVVYLDISGNVLATHLHMVPYRSSRGPKGSYAVLEVSAGVAQALTIGDRFSWSAGS